jgi:hypothetical protein
MVPEAGQSNTNAVPQALARGATFPAAVIKEKY